MFIAPRRSSTISLIQLGLTALGNQAKGMLCDTRNLQAFIAFGVSADEARRSILSRIRMKLCPESASRHSYAREVFVSPQILLGWGGK